MDREGYGPEFDDRLIKLVKENSAIYDVSHPHYRRTPVRMAIWDNIAKELGAPSRFLQTKWKNIRYNYLQEQKCLETGAVNSNVRKRRFTEDLSFLKYTAYRRDGVTPTKSNFNGSDDSSSYMYPDNLSVVNNTYEVIELDHSDDETEDFMPDVSAFLAPMKDITQNSPQNPYDQSNSLALNNSIETDKYQPIISIRQSTKNSSKDSTFSVSPSNSRDSSRSSPLLTPILKTPVTTKIGGDIKSAITNGNTQLYSEVTIQPLQHPSPLKRRLSLSSSEQIVTKLSKHTIIPTISRSINNDSIELYCLSLVDCFRAMPRSERERVKFEFSKILKDAHYKDQS